MQKLIDSAAELFAERGFSTTSVAQICDQAGVNVASVNYHFESKEGLLRAVLQRTFAIADQLYPVTGELVEEMSADERIRNHMEAMIRRCFDDGPGGQFDRIMARLATGTEGIDDLLFEEVTKLQANFPLEPMAEMLGTDDHETLIQTCINFLGLSVGSQLLLPPMRKLFPKPPTDRQIEAFIGRQITFAMGGLANLKDNLPV